MTDPDNNLIVGKTYLDGEPVDTADLSPMPDDVADLEPARIVDPYNMTIAERNTADRDPRGWAIGAMQACFRAAGRTALVPVGERFARYLEPLTVEVHAGIDYVRTLELALPAFATTIVLEHPVAGKQIGQQKRHYAELAAGDLELELEQLELNLGLEVAR